MGITYNLYTEMICWIKVLEIFILNGLDLPLLLHETDL